MKNTQLISDRLAMTLSVACIVHCLFVPAFFISSFALFSLEFSDEIFHYSLLFMAAPISLYALYLGKKNHKSNSFFPVGLLGLAVLFFALFNEGEYLGFPLETIFTLIGSAFLIYAHYKNFRTCQDSDCDCHE